MNQESEITNHESANDRTLLLVDDEANVLAALRRVLHPLPYRVLTAATGSQAIEVALAERPDLIFLDIRMPEMDGFECLKSLREAGLTEVPVVMLTAEDKLMKGYLEGAAYYITKPFKNEHVTNIIEYLIGEPSAERKAWLELRI
jgi:DNA-binding response OmpR family regulator